VPGRNCFMLAYAGPGPGLELIPYFLGLLAWAGMAVGAVILWPVSALLRRLRKARAQDSHQVNAPPMTESLSETPCEGSHDIL
jgi:hypothetical protein